MFLTDSQIKNLKFFKPEYELKSNTLLLHVSKSYVEGENNYDQAKNFNGGYLGGLEYPGQRSFWVKETIDLSKYDGEKNSDIIGIVFGTQNLAARGVLVFPGFIHPGWKGNLIINAITLTAGKKFIEKNAVIAYVAFAETSGKIETLYNTEEWLNEMALKH